MFCRWSHNSQEGLLYICGLGLGDEEMKGVRGRGRLLGALGVFGDVVGMRVFISNVGC